MTEAEIFEKVQEVLEDALGVDPEEVTSEATLTEDLGAESIDFLDIQFRLEKAFEIKIEQGEMFPENILQDGEYVADGVVTEKGIAALKEKMPHADFADFESDPQVEKVAELFTVDAVCKFVANKL